MLKQNFIKLFRKRAAIIFCCGIVLLAHSNVFSQVYYSANSNYLKSKTEKNNLLTSYKSSYPDTAITELHNFLPRNFMGNVALPSPNYIFNYYTPDLGFRLYQNPLYNDMFHEQDVLYYNTKGPYANLTGVTGSKQLQLFKLLYSQTFNEKLNLTIKFNRYSSTGFYLKQQTFANNLNVTSNSTNKKKRAGYYFYFLNNGNRNQENGGIATDTLNIYTIGIAKNLFPVKLNSSSRDNREYKVMLNPWIKLSKTADSLNKLNSYLQLKSKASINIYKFKDANVNTEKFYQVIYLDTVKTYDSTHVMKFTNEINYALLKPDKSFGTSLGYRNEINKVYQKHDSLFMNHIVCSDLIFKRNLKKRDSLQKTSKEIENLFNIQYVLSGSNSGNYKIENRTEFNLSAKRKAKVFLNILTENRSADYIYNNWITNNFNWFNNGYKPQKITNGQIGFSINNKFGASVLYQNIYNYLYFDDIAQPQQYKSTIQNIGVSINYSTVLFKHLGLSLNDIFQSTSHTSYVSVPQNIATVKLFYAANLFKNNLQLNVGAQAQFYQSFYGYAFMPASQMFYLQGKRTTGDYPYLDIYLNARIRPVSIFVKMENVLYNYAGTYYSLVPGYYQTDLAFRLGISWTFFD